MNIIDTGLKFSGTLTKRTRTDYIIVHHAAAQSMTVEQVHQSHIKNNGWIGIGYAYYIRKDGKIYKGRGHEYVGAQAVNYNSNGVGICCEGNYDGPDTHMPLAQFNALVEVVRYLKGIYPAATIKGHRDVNATACPGRYFPFEEMLNVANNSPKIEEEKEEEEVIYNTLKEIENAFGANKDKGGKSVADRIYSLQDNGYLNVPLNELNLTEATIRAMVVMDRRLDAVKESILSQMK